MLLARPASQVVAAALEKDARAKNLVIGKRRVRFDCEEDSPVVAELAKMPQVSSVDSVYTVADPRTAAQAGVGVPGGLGVVDGRGPVRRCRAIQSRMTGFSCSRRVP